MIAVSLFGEKIDLYQNTQIEYVLNNPAFVGGDINKYNGTYTLPFTIPLTPKNRRILRYPDRIDNFNRLIRDIPCHVSFDNKPAFSGLATLKSPKNSRSSKNAKLYIVQDNFRSIRETSLRDLPLGQYEFDSPDATLAHAKSTAENHMDYNHAFFPVRNPRMTEDFEDLDGLPGVPHHYINYYDYMEQEFMNHPSHRSAAPFVRLDHLINIIGQVSGRTIINKFASNEELKSLYIYGGNNIYTNTDDSDDAAVYSWPEYFDLSRQVPDIKAAQLLKEFASVFCLGLFPGPDGSLEILPLKNLVNTPYAQDWTRYADEAYSKDDDIDFPGTFGYESPGDELFNENAYVFRDVPEVIGSRPPAGSPDGIYYNLEANYYLRLINNGHLPQRLDKMFRRVTFDEAGKEYLFSASPLFMTFSDPFYLPIPEILSGPNSNADFRFIFYRGMQNIRNTIYPLASNHVYVDAGGRIPGANHSLLWNGEEGVFNQWWAEWANFLKNKRNVFITMHLPIREIFNMSWQNKVKIENMTYLVKQLKVTLTMKGLKPSKATLVSVL